MTGSGESTGGRGPPGAEIQVPVTCWSLAHTNAIERAMERKDGRISEERSHSTLKYADPVTVPNLGSELELSLPACIVTFRWARTRN